MGLRIHDEYCLRGMDFSCPTIMASTEVALIYVDHLLEIVGFGCTKALTHYVYSYAMTIELIQKFYLYLSMTIIVVSQIISNVAKTLWLGS